MNQFTYGWRKAILFCLIVLMPALIVGYSNFAVFPDSSLPATIMLLITVGVAGVFTYFSGDAMAHIRHYCIFADIAICLILCVNLGGHWLLAREVSAAKQNVEERHTEEDREEKRREAEAERQVALKQAEANLQNAERRRLATLPPEQRRSVLKAPKLEAAPKPTQQPKITKRQTPDQVRDSWWWFLTALAIAECAAGVLAGAILAGIWEWDRNHDGIADHKQAGHVEPAAHNCVAPRAHALSNSGEFPSDIDVPPTRALTGIESGKDPNR